jgi:hypothetical protein
MLPDRYASTLGDLPRSTAGVVTALAQGPCTQGDGTRPTKKMQGRLGQSSTTHAGNA